MIEFLASPIVGWIGGILLGIFVGAAGAYYAEKCTDQRRNQEEQSVARKEFERCQREMPELIDEMQHDIIANPLKSEFVLLDIRLCYGGFPEQPLVYFMNNERIAETYKDETRTVLVHSHLLDKVKMLESFGFVWDVSHTSVPHFKMSDAFKQMMRREKNSRS